MFVKKEVTTWAELREMVWWGAGDVMDVMLEIEKQGREKEALDILEESFWGSIPTETDINDYIRFDLADHMELHH